MNKKTATFNMRMEPEKKHIQIISERPPFAKVLVDGKEIPFKEDVLSAFDYAIKTR